MYTISMLRRSLGLSSDNQVRNRIERIKGLLTEHIRRGPNNQIFLTDPGLELMKQFQELYDSGLTLTEASNVLASKAYKYEDSKHRDSPGLASNMTQPSETASIVLAVREEMALIRDHIAVLEAMLSRDPATGATVAADEPPWWTYLREDVDVP